MTSRRFDAQCMLPPEGAHEIGGNDTISLGGLSVLCAATNNDLQGESGTDNIIGSPKVDTIDGGTEKDTLTGSSGNDTINGGTGNFDDILSGGAGNDKAFW